MSGPKVSEYTLMLQRKRKLELERIEKVKRQEEKENSEKYLRELENMRDIPQLAEDIEILKNNINAIFSENDIQKIINKSRDCKSELQRLKIRADMFSESKSKVTKTQNSPQTFNISNPECGKISSPKADISNLISEKVAHLKSLELSGDMKIRAEKIIQQLNDISDEAYFKNFCSLTVAPFEAEVQKYYQIAEKYETLLSEYHALCTLTDTVPESFDVSEESVEKLLNLIETLNSKHSFEEEQRYIRSCIDDIMENMGYELLGTRDTVKKSGKKFRNELYTFEEGSAVNVTYDSDGKITMELGGIDVTDRLPEDMEKRRLFSDMKGFCNKFGTIEKELEKRGVVLKHLSLMPPDEEFAQIINISEYNTENNYQNCRKISETAPKYTVD